MSLKLTVSLLILGGIEPEKWQHNIPDLCDVVK